MDLGREAFHDGGRVYIDFHELVAIDRQGSSHCEPCSDAQQPLCDLPVLPHRMPEFVRLRFGVMVLPALVEGTPSFRESAHELGGGFIEDALGLFQRLEWAVGEAVECLLESLGEPVSLVRRE